MGKLKTIKKIVSKDKRQLFIAIYNYIVHSGILNGLSDETFLKLTYWVHFHKKLNLDNPVTFSEKLQWLKLNNRNPNYTIMVDKIEVKNYVKSVIGEEYIIPTLGVWDKFADIDFNRLPNQFVLKCNHDSGSVVLCYDKKHFDIAKAKKKIKKGLRTDAFHWGREWPYKNVKRKILAEQYLEEEGSKDIKDYKIYCFDGVAKYCQVISDRRENESIDFFDTNWNHQEFTGLHNPNCPFPHAKEIVERPKKYDIMVSFSEKLATNIPFVRVDFYEINGQVYFGEITFFPDSGFGEFSPSEWNKKIGEMIPLYTYRDKNMGAKHE